jgi:hypothetical protein
MAKGGARLGAGRPAYKVKGEQLQRIDVRIWARRGMLKGPGWFTWSWSRGGEPTGSIGARVDSTTAVTLQYTATIQGDRRDVSERVAIEQVPCNFGGTRPWFCCTRCARQVAVLYLRGGRFACRHCQRLTYSSQSEDLLDRTWSKQRKIEARLGENWQRPKGMRQRTYERLWESLMDCERLRDEAFSVVVQRFLGQR